jgi:sugar phosphate isomerase/epimerase
LQRRAPGSVEARAPARSELSVRSARGRIHRARDGCIDYYAFARLLADIGYSGWVVVEAEQDPAKAPPLEYSRMGLRHLSAAFTAAGFALTN